MTIRKPKRSPGSGKPARPMLERFWEWVQKTDTCWLWTGPTNRDGYGMIGEGGRGSKRWQAHRLSWHIHFGPIPSGMNICHTCDNPPCVRPDHLFLGTFLDNNHDAIRKGHREDIGTTLPHLMGESNPVSKLSASAVIAMRTDWSTGQYTFKQLGAKYGCTDVNARLVVLRKTWTHIP